MAHRHKRDTDARRKPRAALIAGPLALMATASVVTLGVLGNDPGDHSDLVAQDTTADVSAPAPSREPVSRGTVSRGDSRLQDAWLQEKFDLNLARTATYRAVEAADTALWTTTALNLWSDPGEDATQVGVLDAGKKVLVTGRKNAERVEVVVDGRSRWVTAGYLSEEKPVEDKPEDLVAARPDAGIGAACTNGTSVPSGVSPHVVEVHEAVCAAFPEITTYGTFRSDGEHAQGLAVDIMVSGATGWEIAELVRANASQLGVSYVIYSQKIWSVDRSSEGWRWMEDRGSATANHYDHVHVTTY